MTSGAEKYWYNLTTGKVERGFESPAIDRAGPFDTEEEAAKAPKLLAERSRAWAEDDARDDTWGSGAAGSRAGTDDQ
ncbi:SPOR domain-containing protein [Microbacterium sp. zg-YB36]|uniref:SPOR domain-containing protein n=1 Tax=Microbacterium sp. zg-YB36 TaxID=2969407 RepID=UPI00214AF7D0|nr:SPOR domain-containing protein [Microbacterium sp. zg-YB36]MDL5350274.1 SPOR domain-containing protein [Microbacterium sp. zg-YB36]